MVKRRLRVWRGQGGSRVPFIVAERGPWRAGHEAAGAGASGARTRGGVPARPELGDDGRVPRVREGRGVESWSGLGCEMGRRGGVSAELKEKEKRGRGKKLGLLG